MCSLAHPPRRPRARMGTCNPCAALRTSSARGGLSSPARTSSAAIAPSSLRSTTERTLLPITGRMGTNSRTGSAGNGSLGWRPVGSNGKGLGANHFAVSPPFGYRRPTEPMGGVLPSVLDDRSMMTRACEEQRGAQPSEPQPPYALRWERRDGMDERRGTEESRATSHWGRRR